MHPEDTKCTPSRERINFRTFLLGGLDLEVSLVVSDRLSRATTKRKIVNFIMKKCTPDKIMATPVHVLHCFQMKYELSTIRPKLSVRTKNKAK